MQCVANPCPVQECKKYKTLIAHFPACPTPDNCTYCKNFMRFVSLHARGCRDDKCLVPRCQKIKDNLRAQANLISDRRVSSVRVFVARALTLRAGAGIDSTSDGAALRRRWLA